MVQTVVEKVVQQTQQLKLSNQQQSQKVQQFDQFGKTSKSFTDYLPLLIDQLKEKDGFNNIETRIAYALAVTSKQRPLKEPRGYGDENRLYEQFLGLIFNRAYNMYPKLDQRNDRIGKGQCDLRKNEYASEELFKYYVFDNHTSNKSYESHAKYDFIISDDALCAILLNIPTFCSGINPFSLPEGFQIDVADSKTLDKDVVRNYRGPVKVLNYRQPEASSSQGLVHPTEANFKSFKQAIAGVDTIAEDYNESSKKMEEVTKDLEQNAEKINPQNLEGITLQKVLKAQQKWLTDQSLHNNKEDLFTNKLEELQKLLKSLNVNFEIEKQEVPQDSPLRKGYFDPVQVVDRMIWVMKNPNLKQEDRQAQAEDLVNLPLCYGTDCFKLLTWENPVSYIAPESRYFYSEDPLSQNSWNHHERYYSFEEAKEINDAYKRIASSMSQEKLDLAKIESFKSEFNKNNQLPWGDDRVLDTIFFRYLGHQTNRLDMGFYRKELNFLNEFCEEKGATFKERYTLTRLLAQSTCNSKLEPKIQKEKWNDFKAKLEENGNKVYQNVQNQSPTDTEQTILTWFQENHINTDLMQKGICLGLTDVIQEKGSLIPFLKKIETNDQEQLLKYLNNNCEGQGPLITQTREQVEGLDTLTGMLAGKSFSSDCPNIATVAHLFSDNNDRYRIGGIKGQAEFIGQIEGLDVDTKITQVLAFKKARIQINSAFTKYCCHISGLASEGDSDQQSANASSVSKKEQAKEINNLFDQLKNSDQLSILGNVLDQIEKPIEAKQLKACLQALSVKPSDKNTGAQRKDEICNIIQENLKSIHGLENKLKHQSEPNQGEEDYIGNLGLSHDVATNFKELWENVVYTSCIFSIDRFDSLSRLGVAFTQSLSTVSEQDKSCFLEILGCKNEFPLSKLDKSSLNFTQTISLLEATKQLGISPLEHFLACQPEEKSFSVEKFNTFVQLSSDYYYESPQEQLLKKVEKFTKANLEGFFQALTFIQYKELKDFADNLNNLDKNLNLNSSLTTLVQKVGNEQEQFNYLMYLCKQMLDRAPQEEPKSKSEDKKQEQTGMVQFSDMHAFKSVIAQLAGQGKNEETIKQYIELGDQIVAKHPNSQTSLLELMPQLSPEDMINLQILSEKLDSHQTMDTFLTTFNTAFMERVQKGKGKKENLLSKILPKLEKVSKEVSVSEKNIEDIVNYLIDMQQQGLIKTDHVQKIASLTSDVADPRFPNIDQGLGNQEWENKPSAFDRHSAHQMLIQIEDNENNKVKFDDSLKSKIKGFDSTTQNLFMEKDELTEGFSDFLKTLNEYRTKPYKGLLALKLDTDAEKLAYLIELHARTGGREDGKTSTTVARECNLTQVLALYSIINRGDDKLMAEIKTGEGKTGISDITTAFYALKGKTVDRMTSDMELAKRDFIQAQRFYRAAGIKTVFCMPGMSPEQYLKSGQEKGVINFSDSQTLSLLRVEYDAYGLKSAFRDEKEKSVMFVDECDQQIYDGSSTSYNFSVAQENEQEQQLLLDIYTKVEQLCSKTELTSEQINQIAYEIVKPVGDESENSVDQGKIKLWVQSAQTALTMNQGSDYQISQKPEPVATSKGTRYYNVIEVLSGGYVQPGKYADAVDQFLAIKHKDDKVHCSSLSKTVNTDHIINQVEDYSQIVGVTGTSRQAFKQDGLNTFDLKYVTVPRHSDNRLDKKPLKVVEPNEHYTSIINAISSQDGQPKLVFFKDDKALQDFIDSGAYTNRDKNLNINIINANSSSKNEADAIESLKDKNKIVLTTSRLGRGKDFPKNNIHVVLTDIMSSSDYEQAIGRTARNGNKGSCKSIINQDSLELKCKSENGSGSVLLQKYLIDQRQHNQQTLAQLLALITKQLTRNDNLLDLATYDQISGKNSQYQISEPPLELEQINQIWKTAYESEVKQLISEGKTSDITTKVEGFVKKLKSSEKLDDKAEKLIKSFRPETYDKLLEQYSFTDKELEKLVNIPTAHMHLLKNKGVTLSQKMLDTILEKLNNIEVLRDALKKYNNEFEIKDDCKKALANSFVKQDEQVLLIINQFYKGDGQKSEDFSKLLELDEVKNDSVILTTIAKSDMASKENLEKVGTYAASLKNTDILTALLNNSKVNTSSKFLGAVYSYAKSLKDDCEKSYLMKRLVDLKYEKTGLSFANHLNTIKTICSLVLIGSSSFLLLQLGLVPSIEMIALTLVSAGIIEFFAWFAHDTLVKAESTTTTGFIRFGVPFLQIVLSASLILFALPAIVPVYGLSISLTQAMWLLLPVGVGCLVKVGLQGVSSYSGLNIDTRPSSLKSDDLGFKQGNLSSQEVNNNINSVPGEDNDFESQKENEGQNTKFKQ
ncbi:helicase-related protein [Gammaproteobacteria bacterium]|nr:helicase-related protein [Gammaproteobacteria bacterium]